MFGCRDDVFETGWSCGGVGGLGGSEDLPFVEFPVVGSRGEVGVLCVAFSWLPACLSCGKAYGPGVGFEG